MNAELWLLMPPNGTIDKGPYVHKKILFTLHYFNAKYSGITIGHIADLKTLINETFNQEIIEEYEKNSYF